MAETEAVYYRFPPGLKLRLKQAARGTGRSVNAEVVARLEVSLASPYKDGISPVVAMPSTLPALDLRPGKPDPRR